MAKIENLTRRLAKAQDVEDRREAARQLRDAGFARRMNLEKRGSLGEAAESTLAAHELDALHGALTDDDRNVRRAAIVAAGDFGDASSVSVLIEQLDSQDEEIRLATIDSLGDIGGVESIDALTRLGCDNEEDRDIRLAALTGLEELAAKPITSGPDRRFDPPDDPAAAVRDLDETEEVKQAKAGLLEACAAIAVDAQADDLLRLKATEVRAYLESGIA